MKTRLVGLLLVAGWFFSGLAAAAEPDSPSPDSPQAADEWRGRRVLAAKPGLLLREQPNEQAPTSPVSTAGIWLEAKRSERDWLEVDWGWIRKADVVRDDQAVEFFTAALARNESAFAYLARSRAWLEKNEFDKAQADASEALRLEPNNARAYTVRSRIAAKQERAEEERAACDCALAIDPRDPFALEARSRLKAAAGEVDGAIGDLDLAIESSPRDSRLRSLRGYYGELKGDYDQALADFNEAIQLDPHATYPLSRRATIHLRRQEIDKALHDIGEALRVDAKLPQALAIRGAIRAKQREWDAALADLDEAIRLDATDPVAFYNRGGARYYKGQYDAAVLDFTQAISLNPDGADSYAARADAWMKQGDATSAIADLTQYLRLRPMNANAHSKRGAALLAKGDVDAAFKDLNAALAISPRHIGALLGRSRAWELKNEPAKAIDDVNAALALVPNKPDAYVVRGWLRRDADPDAALKDLDAALAIDPRRLDALLGRAEIWHRKGAPEQAIANLTAAIEVDPKFSDAYWRRAQVYSSQGDRRRAIDDLTAVLRIKPGDVDCLLRRSRELSFEGYHRQAIADCRAVLAKDPKNLKAYAQMAQAHAMAGEKEEALDDYAAALSIDPHDDQIHFDRANELFDQGKVDLALADVEEVLRHGKRVADAYSWRGYFSMRRGNLDKALADFNEAIRLEPDDAEHYRMRADCWYAMKQFDKAVADADRALRLHPNLESAAHVRRQALEAKQDPAKADDRYGEATPYGGDALADAQFKGAFWFELRGPKGMKYTQEFAPSGEFGPRLSAFPARLLMLGDFSMPLKLVEIPGAADAALYAQLQAQRLSAEESKQFGGVSPSMTLTKADLDAALAGKEVTKILVLRRKAGDETGEEADEPELEVVSSTELDAKTDPAEAAAARGTIVATLELKNAPFEADDETLEQISRDAVVTGLTDEQQARIYEVELKGPEGVKLRFATGGPEEFGPASAPFPLRAPMLDGGVASFKLAGLPGDAEVYLLIGSKQLSPQDLATVRAMKPAITLAQVDLDAAVAGKDVTKILVLRRKAGAETDAEAGETEVEVVSSTELDAKTDPAQAASARGTIVAVLTLSRDPSPAACFKMLGLAIGAKRAIGGLTEDERAHIFDFEIQGPDGMKAAFVAAGPDETYFEHLPLRLPMLDDSLARLKLTDLPGRGDAAVYVLLKSKRLPADQIAILRNAKPSLTLTQADLDAALAGKRVTCVVYLARPEQEGEAPRLQTLSSASNDSADDPLAEARKRGAIVATLLLSRQIDDLPSAAPKAEGGEWADP